MNLQDLKELQAALNSGSKQEPCRKCGSTFFGRNKNGVETCLECETIRITYQEWLEDLKDECSSRGFSFDEGFETDPRKWYDKGLNTFTAFKLWSDFQVVCVRNRP